MRYSAYAIPVLLLFVASAAKAGDAAVRQTTNRFAQTSGALSNQPPDFQSLRKQADAVAAAADRELKLYQVGLHTWGTPHIFHYFRAAPTGWLRVMIFPTRETAAIRERETVAGPAPQPVPQRIIAFQDAFGRLNRPVPKISGNFSYWYLVLGGAQYALDSLSSDLRTIREGGPAGRWVWAAIVEKQRQRPWEYVYVDAVSGDVSFRCADQLGGTGRKWVPCPPPSTEPEPPRRRTNR